MSFSGEAAKRSSAPARREFVAAALLLAALCWSPCTSAAARAESASAPADGGEGVRLDNEQLAIATGPTADAAGSTAKPASDDWDAWEAELDSQQNTGFTDPLERYNRKVFAFNIKLDYYLFDPLTRFYARIAPVPVRKMVLRGFDHMRCPSVFVNDLLQREWIDAATTLIRFAVNTPFGVVGLFDTASYIGAPGHYSDFGQTLALYSVPSGPYLILPVMGPNTVRDLIGNVVDVFFQPTSYLLPGLPQILFFEGTLKAASGFSTREANFEALQALSASSVDYYASMHSAYSQDRLAQIWARRESHRTASGT
jgi:phospholipid-binding lipoprotein MlaA